MEIKKIYDLKVINEVIKKFNNTFSPSTSSIVGNLNKYSKKIYKYATTIVAIKNNEIVGYASFYCNDSINQVAYLSQIVVKEEFRGLGISNLILRQVEKICLENDMKYLKLEVYNDNNKAINFYKKNQFTVVDFASNKSKYMIKTL